MTFERFRHILVLTALVTLALSVSGCAGGAGWGATLAILTSLTMLFAAGCNQTHSGSDDAGVIADAGDPPPTFDAGDGNWERCCVDGEIDSCFCPAGAACNYGWFTDCGGGTCSFGPDGCGPDAGMEDAGVDAGSGDWEPCCVDGVVDSCFCPAGAECNYGWFIDCGDGTCGPSDESCDVDAGAPDAGAGDAGVDAGLDGYWENCCVDGMVDSCFCPGGAICNYGWYNDCGDGTCTHPGTMCPAP